MTTIIVALDTPVYREALFIISELKNKALCNWFKVGMECFYSYDGELVMTELENAKCKVFLDLKLNDIPTTVEKATTVLLNRFPFIEMLSVRTPHAVGAALRAASAVGWKGLVVHVPVLSCEAETGVAVPSAAPAIVCRPSMVPQYKHHGHVTVAVGLRDWLQRCARTRPCRTGYGRERGRLRRHRSPDHYRVEYSSGIRKLEQDMQSKRWSLIEATVGQVLGLITGWLCNLIVLPMFFGVHVGLMNSLWITIIFTVISFVRSYFVRRMFNWVHVKVSSNV
jgi:hypothetical protein